MAERLIDGGFETWASNTNLTYWTETTAGASVVARSTAAKYGAFCCQLDIDVSDSEASVMQAVYLVPGRKYTFSVWYKMSVIGKTAAILIRDSTATKYLDSTATWQSGAQLIMLPNTTTWQRFSIDFTASASYSYYHVILSNSGTAGAYAFFDNASLVPHNMCGFLWDNKWDSGTLTASSAANYFPATNTRHRWYKKPWRSANLAAPDFLALDAGAAVSADMFVIRYDNFNSTSTVAIQAHTAGDDWANASVNNTITLNNSTMAHVWGTAQSYRYWRLSITDANNPANYVEVGRCFLGTPFEPTRGAVIGGGMREQTDPSIIQMSDEGQTSTIKKTKYRTGGVQFSLLPESDKDQFENLYANVGEANSFVFVEDMGDPWGDTYYVEITSFEVVPRYGSQYDVRIGMKESR